MLSTILFGYLGFLWLMGHGPRLLLKLFHRDPRPVEWSSIEEGDDRRHS